MAVPNKIRERMQGALKRMVPIIAQQKARDVSEADTVTLVKDLLHEVFGYDKYGELTSEHAIRGTFCDLAVKVDDKLIMLIEVKSVGSALDDRHVKQTVDYASNQGVEWVVLTNGATWRLYQVIFAKPIDKRLLCEMDLLTIDSKSDEGCDCLWLYTKEGFLKGAHIELRDRQDATSRYLLSALLLENDAVVSTIRRELRRVVDVSVGTDEIIKVLRAEVIKRDTLEGPQAEDAVKRVTRQERKLAKAAKASSTGSAQADQEGADGTSPALAEPSIAE